MIIVDMEEVKGRQRDPFKDVIVGIMIEIEQRMIRHPGKCARCQQFSSF